MQIVKVNETKLSYNHPQRNFAPGAWGFPNKHLPWLR